MLACDEFRCVTVFILTFTWQVAVRNIIASVIIGNEFI